MGGRNFQAVAHIYRRLPQQGTAGQVHHQDVPSEHLRRRSYLPRHPAEPMEPNLRHLSHPDINTVSAHGS